MIWSDEDTVSGKVTHAVDILAFVEAQEIPVHYFETPYQLVPAPGGERLYSLLRETLQHTHRIGIAYVVIQAHQHLAALVPQGQSLVLNTLRCGNEADALSTLRPEPEDDDDPEMADIRDMELSLVAQNGGEPDAPCSRDGFRADIVTPEFLTEDDDDIDSALAHMLRRHAHAPDGYRTRRQRATGGQRNSRPRARSRLLS